MSTPFPLKIGAKEYLALPTSFAFQKQNKDKFKLLQAGTLAAEDAQFFMADMVVHCIKRGTPDADVAAIEADLDAIAISIASVEIGRQTQKQVAAAYGRDFQGEAKAGEAAPTSTSTVQ